MLKQVLLRPTAAGSCCGTSLGGELANTGMCLYTLRAKVLQLLVQAQPTKSKQTTAHLALHRFFYDVQSVLQKNAVVSESGRVRKAQKRQRARVLSRLFRNQLDVHKPKGNKSIHSSVTLTRSEPSRQPETF